MTALATAEAAMPAAATDSIEAIPVYGLYDGRDWLTREMIVIGLVKALTDWIGASGYGAFLYEPEARGARASLYDRAGIEGWSTWMDREACGRLRIWFWKVREQGSER